MNNQEINVQPTADEQVEKKAYTKPGLKRFGGLSELVQLNPGIGTDGGGFPPDCTLS